MNTDGSSSGHAIRHVGGASARAPFAGSETGAPRKAVPRIHAQVVDFQPKRRKKSDYVALCRIKIRHGARGEDTIRRDAKSNPRDAGATPESAGSTA
jgi:hypothetical protein